MDTVGSLVDRVLHDFLEPPDELWVRTVLTSPVDATTTEWSVDFDRLSHEEQQLFSTGVLVEAGSEQALVTDVTLSTLTVRRGVRGTTAASHAADAQVVASPPFTRTAVFDAVADSLVGLHPPLWVARQTVETVGADGVTSVPSEMMAATRVRRIDTFAPVGFHDLGVWTDGRSLRVYDTPQGQTVQVDFRAAIPRPTSEAQALVQLGVEPSWARIAVVGAAAQLMAAKPMSVAWQDYVTAQLRSEAYPVDTPGRIRDALVRYHEYLLDKAAASLAQRHPTDIIEVPL